MVKTGCLSWLLFAVFAPGLVWGGSSGQLCQTYFQRKQYSASARCFDGLVKTLATPKTEEARFQKGRWLRSAWLSALRAANTETQLAKKTYLLAEVVRRIRAYLSGKMYETPHQKRLAEVRLTGVQASIGYAQLSVVSGGQSAAIQINGYQFEAASRGSWSGKVRPGSYTIRMASTDKAAQIKIVNVKPDTPLLVRFAPTSVARHVPPRRVIVQIVPRRMATRTLRDRPLPKPPLRKGAAPWILIGVGVVAVLGGSALFSVGVYNRGIRDDFKKTLLAGSDDVKDTRAFLDHSRATNGAYVGGGISFGVGLSLIAAGTIVALK